MTRAEIQDVIRATDDAIEAGSIALLVIGSIGISAAVGMGLGWLAALIGWPL